MIRAVGVLVCLMLLAACAVPYVQTAGNAMTPPSVVEVASDETLAVRASDGKVLPLRHWPAATPHAVVIGVHGFNDYSNTFEGAGRWWSSRGLTTYAYDQRGFGAAPQAGTWPGTTLLVRDLNDVVRAVRARHPDLPLYLHGNSMGGAVVLVALARRGVESPLNEIAGATLTAPAVWGGPAMSPFYRWALWVAAHAFPKQRVTGQGLGVLPSDNIEMLRSLGRDPLIIKETRIDSLYGLVRLMGAGQRAARYVDKPLLVMYGAHDEVIPRGPTASMAEYLGENSRFAVYPNGYHMLLRDLQAEVVWRDVAAWITNHEAPLPSDAEVPRTNLFAKVGS